MKKVILIVVIISSIFFGYGYYFMQKSSKLITQNEESIYEIEESNGSNSILSDEEFTFVVAHESMHLVNMHIFLLSVIGLNTDHCLKLEKSFLSLVVNIE